MIAEESLTTEAYPEEIAHELSREGQSLFLGDMRKYCKYGRSTKSVPRLEDC
jgi:hypothetical protein